MDAREKSGEPKQGALYDTQTRFKEGEQHSANHEEGHCRLLWAEGYTAGPRSCIAWAKGRQAAVAEDRHASRFDGCPHANAMLALRTLKEAFIAEGDPDSAATAQELWDKAAELNSPGAE